MSVRPFRDIKRKKTKTISVGKVKIGGANRLLFNQWQYKTRYYSTIDQINKIEQEGADLVRVSCLIKSHP